MIVSAAASLVAFSGVFGATIAALAPFVSLVPASLLPPVLALATRGAFYEARTSTFPDGDEDAECVVCGGTFELLDMATCPFHDGAICSLSCSIEGACRDACKPSAWLPRRPVALGMPGTRPTIPEPVAPAAFTTLPEAGP